MRAKYTSSIRHIEKPDKIKFGETLYMTRKRFCWWILIFTVTYGSVPDAYSQARKPQKTEEENQPLPMKTRWAFKTNAIDWLLLIPNATLEFDLTASPYNKMTLSLGGKWNWNTSQNYNPSWVYNLWDVRPEIRYYWRTKQRNWKRDEKVKVKFSTWLKEDVFSKEKPKARTWRAYYVGAYINAGKYSFKLSDRGIQGITYGAGVSVGFGMPLYGYKNHAIDLELGGSIGIAYTSYDAFTYDNQSHCYPLVPGQSKKGHFIPFPVITDLRASFVYRFVSVRDKYKKTDQAKIDARNKCAAERKNRKNSEKMRRDSTNTAKKLAKELEYKNDSIRKITEKIESFTKKQQKQTADSLNRIEKDSIASVAKREKKKSGTAPAPSVTEQILPLPTDSINKPVTDSNGNKKTTKEKKEKKKQDIVKAEKKKKKKPTNQKPTEGIPVEETQSGAVQPIPEVNTETGTDK